MALPHGRRFCQCINTFQYLYTENIYIYPFLINKHVTPLSIECKCGISIYFKLVLLKKFQRHVSRRPQTIRTRTINTTSASFYDIVTQYRSYRRAVSFIYVLFHHNFVSLVWVYVLARRYIQVCVFRICYRSGTHREDIYRLWIFTQTVSITSITFFTIYMRV